MEETSQTNLSRREALKALVATGGALAAAAFVPGKWAKPVIEGGVVPAHAQSTLPPLSVAVVQACDEGTATVSYSDPAGLVTNASHVVVYIRPCDQVILDGPLGDAFASGNGFSGTLFFNFPINCAPNTVDQLCVQLFVDGRYADDCGPFEFCGPA